MREYGLDTESGAARRLLDYLALLTKWNARIDLTAGTDWARIGPFFRESLWASGFYPIWADSMLDIGSGAGFPAIPMRILIPRIRLDMIESRAKRAAFLETTVGELGLEGASVHCRRLEEHLRRRSSVWDCIAWKGLRLSGKDLAGLRERAHAETQFWMFHGKRLAIEKPEFMARDFSMIRSEKCIGRKEWRLSIYTVR
jgi:16S rRNA (guanine(527)-N(7))-methyltransferase RsmG